MSDERHGIEVEIDSRPAKAGEDRVVRSLDNIKKKTEEVGKAGEEAGKRTTAANDRGSKSAERAGRTIDNIKGKMRAAANDTASVGERIEAAWKKAAGGIDRATASAARLHPQLAQIQQNMNKVSHQRPFTAADTSAKSFTASLMSMKAVLAAVATGAAVSVGAEIARTAVQFKGFDQSLRIITGSQEAANAEFKYAEELAARMGFRVRDITASYIGFSAASRGTALEGEKSRVIYEQLAKAGAAYGLTNDQLKGALLAVQQMMSKGTVQAEELRGQLGERLPGAFQIAARAMGVTTGELSKMLEGGKVLSAEFLPLFAQQLGKEIPDGVKSANASFNDFLTQLDKAKIAIANSGFFEGLTQGAKVLGDAMAGLARDGTLDAIGAGLGGLLSTLGGLLPLLKAAAVGWITYAAAMKGAAILNYVGELMALQRALGAANTAQALFGAGTVALQRGLAMILGPIGLLVAGVTAAASAYMYLSSENSRMQGIVDGSTNTLRDSANALNEAAMRGHDAASAANSVGAESGAAVNDLNNFAGSVKGAADEMFRMAEARKADALADLNARRVKASVEYSEAWGKTQQGRRSRGRAALGTEINSVADFTRSFGDFIGAATDEVGARLGYGTPEAELQESMRNSQRSMAAYDRAIKMTHDTPVNAFEKGIYTPPVVTPKPTKPKPDKRDPNYETRQTWDLQDVKARFESRGARITSDLRSREKQQQLYNDWLAGGKKGMAPAKPGTSNHEKGQAIDIGKGGGMSMAKIRDIAKDMGLSIKELYDEGDHFHLAWKSTGGALSDANKEFEKMQKLADERIVNEANFWQTLKNEVTTAGMLPLEAEKMNKQLELQTILADGVVSKIKELTPEQKMQVNLEVQRGANAKFVAGLTAQTVQGTRDTLQLTREQLNLGQGTIEQIEDKNALESKMHDLRTQALLSGVDLTDETVKKAFEELEIREKTNIELARKNRLIAEGNNLVEQLLDSADPKRGLQREFGRDMERINNSNRPQAEKDRAIEILKKQFGKSMNEVNDKFRQDMMSSIDSIATAFGGKIGQAIGAIGNLVNDIVAMTQKDYKAGTVGATANNPLSKVFNSLKGMTDTFKAGGKMDRLFGEKGTLVKNLGSKLGKASDGAAVGDQINNLAKAIGFKKFSKTGAQIGGAIGSFLPIPGGQIIGSVIGGTIGSLFKKNARGQSTLTGSGDPRLSGNNADAKGAAGSMGEAVQQGIQNIAKALGAEIGAFKVSIGMYKDKIRVNPSGGVVGGKKGSGAITFKTEADAIRYAILNAIKDGALKGLSAATERVLKAANSKTLDKVLEAAQMYEALARAARELEDPVKAAFDEFKKGMDQTIKQLTEAGYSTEEIGKLQVVFAEQQKQMLKDMTQGYRDFIQDITKGPDSGRTVFDQFNDALASFRTLATGGKFTQEEFTSSGQKLFDLARQVYGSATPEFEAIKAELVKTTQDALAKVEGAANDSSAVVDAVVTTAATATTQRDRQIALLEQIAANMNGGARANVGVVGRGGY